MFTVTVSVKGELGWRLGGGGFNGGGGLRVYREEALESRHKSVKRGGLNYFLGQAVPILECSGQDGRTSVPEGRAPVP